MKHKKIGVFAKDMALKNFIFQVNNLKNREYDLNQVIEEFNSNWELSQKKKESENSLDLSSLESPLQQSIINQQYRSLPLTLDIPEKEFFTFLENEFYKSIHHDLLNKKHLLNLNDTMEVSYKSFGLECVSLSKLLDELNLLKKEKELLINLPQKDEKGFFVDKFLESFLRYKKKKLTLHPIPMHFFISKIIQPLFVRLSSKKDFSRIYSILVKIQTMMVRDGLHVGKHSKSLILPQKPKESINSSQILKSSKSEKSETSLMTFRKWIDSLEADPLGGSLSSKEFWIMAMTKIFNTNGKTVSTSDSSLLEKSLISANSMKKFHNKSDVDKSLSFFERIKKGGKKLMKLHPEDPSPAPQQSFSIEIESSDIKSVSKESNSEINKEIVKEMIMRNLLSCKPFMSSPKDFKEVVDFLDVKLVDFEVNKMWDSLDVATYFDSEVQKLTLICFEKQDLKSLKISNLLKQISIFD